MPIVVWKMIIWNHLIAYGPYVFGHSHAAKKVTSISAIELHFSPNDTIKFEYHSIHNQPNTSGQTQTGKLTNQW